MSMSARFLHAAVALAIVFGCRMSAADGTGLVGTYFGNQDLSGVRVVRTDATVDFAWGGGVPVAGIGADHFSVRWTGQVQALATEQVTFHTVSDDGVRLWIGGTLVIDQWNDHGAAEHQGSIALVAGQRYDIRMEFYENGGDAVAKLLWSSASIPKQVVPQDRLHPSVPAGSGSGLLATYHDNANFTGAVVRRTDATVDFDWAGGAPVSGIAADTFSVRWVGEIEARYGETYTFAATTDDGVRLWVGGQLVIDHWSNQSATERTGSIALTAGVRYPLVMEYYENGGSAVAKLSWSSPSTPKQIIPSTQLYPLAPLGTGTGLLATYFDNLDLTGATVERSDAVVDFDWAGGSPDAVIAADTFSARWTGEIDPRTSEVHTFSTISDDGVRLWVDGQLLIDQWNDHGATEHQGSIALTAGKRVVVVMEFYERYGAAVAKLAWSTPTLAKAIVPASQLHPAAALGTGTGLLAQYYDERYLTGPARLRIDAGVDFDWGGGSPISGINPDTFSVRWSGEVEPRYSETYTFRVTSDDGVRLWVAGQLIIDQWNDHSPRVDQGTIALIAGHRHPIVLEYYENAGGAVARLGWSSASTPVGPIPATQLHPAAVVGTGTGLLATYFDQPGFAGPGLTRVDATVDFDWAGGSPASAIAPDTFSARWVGEVQAQFSETVTFQTLSDDGVRLWVGGQLLVDQWNDHGAAAHSGSIDLVAGQRYPIVMEFYENGGAAVARLRWSSARLPLQPVPQSQLYPALIPGTGTGLTGTYFDNRDFSGTSVSRLDPAIDFDWSGSAPVAGIGADTFSVRWLGEVQPYVSETYTFTTISDDGIRVWVGDQLVIDHWTDHSATARSGTIALTGGQRHPLRVEFYENGGAAVAKLLWASPSTPAGIIPVTQLYPAVDPGQTVAAPVLSPAGGTFTAGTVVTLSTATPGATIRYTLDGSDPTSASPAVSGPLAIAQNTILTARAFLSGWNPSPAASGTYAFVAASPTISPDGGSFSTQQTVTLATATAGAEIRYTLDGSSPDQSSTLFTAPFTVAAAATVSARAFRAGWNPSAATTASFAFKAVAPLIAPAGGDFAAPQAVQVTSTTIGGEVRYTLDGSDPTAGSPLVSGPLTIDRNATLTARTFRAGWTPSDAAQAAFTFTPAAPTLAPAGGTYQAAQAVTLASTTPETQIRYTLDGSEPGAGSPLASGPVLVDASLTLRARAFRTGWSPSPISEGGYVLRLPAPTISPAGGSFTSAQTVSLSSSAGDAAIHYTTDGSGPDEHSPLYLGAFVVPANMTVSAIAIRPGWSPSPAATASFVITPSGQVPELWRPAPGFVVETIAGGLQLPVNVVFVPNPGSGATDPWLYITELYGTVKVVTRDGGVHDYATGLLDFAPLGAFPGSGEQGLAGILVEPETGDVLVSVVSAAGGLHHPRVLRLHSSDGGRTSSSRTVLLDMPTPAITNSHMASNLSIGPDAKLYLHIGYGDDAASALDLQSFGGKVIRFNRDGSPATDNPFFDAGDGISAKDYVFAYGLRNPFGGDWRAADGKHYAVENGPQVDRLARIDAGASYGYDGSNASMALRAIFNWNVPHAPVNLAFVQAATFGGSGFPIGRLDHAFVSESGPTFASGPQLRGKRISEFAIDGSGVLLSGPTPLVEYVGAGRSTAAGLAAGADGLYFTDLFPDAATDPSARGAQLLRVRHVGASPVLPVVTLAAAAAEITEGGAAGAFVVTRSGPVGVALPVAYQVISRPDAASPDADYQALSGLVVIPAGAASVSIPLLTIDDQQAEGDEGVTLALAPGTGYGSGAQTGAAITIRDNDTPRPVTVTVAIGERLQPIEGIGGNLANGRFTGSPTPNDAVGTFMLDAVPPAQARIGIPLKGWEPVNDDADPANASPAFAAADAGDVHQVFVLMQQLTARGIPVVASIWDAPDWLVGNPAARERRAIPVEREAELVESIVMFLLRARDQYGVTVAAVSFNEADGGFQLVLSAQQHARLITAVSTRAAASGLTVRWLAGDTAIAATLVQYAQPVLADAAARPHLAALSYHTWDAPRVSDTVLGEIATLAQAHGLPVWAAEVGYDPLLHLGDPAVFASWSHAWQMGKASHRAFVHARATVVDLWSYQGDYPLAAGGVLHPAGKVAHQLATSLPRGTQRVRASADDTGVWALAAAHRALDYASLTLVNTYSLPVTVTVLGLPALPCAIVRSDATAQEAPVGSATPGAAGLVLTLAPQSFTTLTTGLGFGGGNQPPVVAAGADQNVTLPAVASLSASVSDDGLPAGETLTSSWSQVSGPGVVGFADSQALATVASFPQAGTYVLAHSANDGLATSVDQVVITVTGGDGGTPPLVAFAAPVSQHGEAAGTVAVALVLDHASSAQVSVTYELAPGGSATAGADTGPVTGTVVFAPGDVTKSIPVAIIDDALDEDDESLVIRLALASGAVIGAPAQHALTIVDNDATPTVSFAQPAVTVAEAIGTLQVAITLSAPSGRTATVAYAVSGGSARGPGQSPSDYVLAPGTLVFAPGETTKQIGITVIDDALDELDETIELALANAVNAQAAAGHLIATISDNDAMPPVSFVDSQDTVDEPAGSAAVVVAIPAPSGRDITVQYAPAGVGDAINGAPTPGADADYVLAAGAVTIPAGSTTATIAVAIIDDLRNEGFESLALDITALDGGVAGAIQRTELLIRDNDPLPSVGFTATAPVVDEGAGTVSVPLVLSAASGRSVTVSYQAAVEAGADVATNGDPADAGTDLQVLPGQIVFAPGEISAAITFPIVDDALPELSEHVTLVLSSPANAVLGAQSTQQVVITDNDGSAGLVALAASTLQVDEGAGSAAVGIVANHALAEDVQVHFIISAGSAVVGDPGTEGTDVGLAFGDVVLPAGALTASIAVPIVDDTLPEPGETATLTVTQVTAVDGGPLTSIYLGSPSATVLTIIDNDLPQLAFGFDIVETDEGAAEQVSIPVVLSRPSDQPVTVQIVLGGSATEGVDFTAAQLALSFPPGETSAMVVVTIIADTAAEGDEAITLTLTDAVGAIVPSPVPCTVLIGNDDLPAPVVQYVQSTPTGIDIYGVVPGEFGVTGITTEILGQVFHVHVDNNATTPSTGATLSLTFNDDRTPTHHSPSTTTTQTFGDGQGGGSSSGSPTELPPATPRVSVAINGGLSGDRIGQVDDQDVHFSNQTAGPVQVWVTASAGPSAITSLTLYLDNGQSFVLTPGSGVSKNLPSLPDGRYVLSATATATNAAGESAVGTSPTDSQVVLYIDTVKPTFRYILADQYLPAGFNAATDAVPAMRNSLTDDADLVLLNKNQEDGDTGNKSLRFGRNMNVFAQSGFAILAEVDDLTGLSNNDRALRAEYKPQGSQSSHRGNFTMTLIPPQNGNGQRFSIAGLGGLPESIKLNRQTMKVTEHSGRYTLQIKARDRAGNQLKDGDYADQFKLWVDITEPWALIGTVGAPPVNDREVTVSPVRFIFAHHDVAEAWQDSVDEGSRMLRMQPTTLASSYAVDDKPISLWRLKTPQAVGVGSSGTVSVQLMDFAGNRTSSSVPVEFTRKSLEEPSPTSDHKEPVSLPREVPLVSAESPSNSTTSWFSGQDKTYGQSNGLFDAYKGKPQSLTITNFSESEFSYKTRLVVNPLEPGSGGSRKWTPSIMSVAPSWKKPFDAPQLTVIANDTGLGTVRGVYGDFPDETISPADYAEWRGSGSTIRGFLRLPHDQWSGGFKQVSYQAATGRSSPEFINVSYSQSAGFRWTNVVRVHPDVVAAGQRVTVRIEAGFLGTSLKWPSNPDSPGAGEFNPLGDYVRFVYANEGDAQQAVAKAQAALTAAQSLDPADPGAVAQAQANLDAATAASSQSDPTETAEQVRQRQQQQSSGPVATNRISIVGQRLVAPGVNQSLQQQLEIDLDIGADMLAKLFHIDLACGEVKEMDDPEAEQFKASQGTPAGRSAHRVKEGLSICKIEVNPISLWQLEDKEYAIEVGTSEGAAQPAGDVWIRVMMPHLPLNEVKDKVKAWNLGWAGMEPHCFYLKQGGAGFTRQPNQTQIAVDDGKARFLGGMTCETTADQLHDSDIGIYEYVITGALLAEMGFDEGLEGQVVITQRRFEQELKVDADFLRAPLGATTLFGSSATVHMLSDDGPHPVLKPASGTTGQNAKFAVQYDSGFTATGTDPAAGGDGANQAAPILSWSSDTDFIVGGDRIGDTMIQVFPVIDGGIYRTAGPVLELPIQVDMPVLSEPGIYHIDVARRNLELRRSHSGDGDLQQHPTPIPPAGGGVDNDWKLPATYTMSWGFPHAGRTLNTDDLDSVFEFCQFMIAQVAPVKDGSEGAWHQPVSGPDAFFQIPPQQADPGSAAYELALDQYRRMWNSGSDTSDQVVAERLRKSGPPLQQWLRFAKHTLEGNGRAKRTDPTMERQRRFLEVKLKTYMDQGALARMKRYFSLRHDYRTNIGGVLGITIDQALQTVRAPEMPHQGPLLIDEDLAWWTDLGNWFSDSFFHTGPLTRLFETPMTPNWHVGHPFTEEVINTMITERASWVRRLLKDIDAAVQPGSDSYPITVQTIDGGLYSSILSPMSQIPLTHVLDANQRIEFRVPERFWAYEPQFNAPRFRDRSGTPVPNIILLWEPNGVTGGIGRDSRNGFRLRVQHGLTDTFDLEVRASPTSPKGTNAASVIRLMGEIHALEAMLNDRAATIFWQNAEAHMGKFGFLMFCVGDFFAATTDIYRTIWGRDLVTDQQLTVEERLMSGMMVGITVLTGGVPGSALANKGFKVLRKGLSRDVAATARQNVAGVADELATAIDDAAEGGQQIAGAANTTRRVSGRNTQLGRNALEEGLRTVNRLLDLPVTDFLRLHSGLGRMTESIVVRTGSQAPHLNPLVNLRKAATRPIPSPIALRSSPTAKTSDSFIGAAQDLTMANRVTAAGRAGQITEKECSSYVNGIVQCFPAGTLVLMGDGTWKTIESIVRGDVVRSRSQQGHESPTTLRQVTSTVASPADNTLELKIVDAQGGESVIRCTDDHPFWVHGRGWTSAQDITDGASIEGDIGGLKVMGKTINLQPVTVYNLEIDSDRTYFVSSISMRGPPHALWVHNSNCAQRRMIEAQIKKQAQNAGVELTEQQVLLAVKELVERMAFFGGSGMLAQADEIADAAVRKVVNRVTLHNPLSPVVFVREAQGSIDELAKKYEASATGAISHAASGDRVVPALRFKHPSANSRTKDFVKFDVRDPENPFIFIDRKFNATTKSKQIRDVRRVAEALNQNPDYMLRIEVPNQTAYGAAIRLLKRAGIANDDGVIENLQFSVQIVP